MADYDTALTARQGAGCGIVACGEERRWGEEWRGSRKGDGVR